MRAHKHQSWKYFHEVFAFDTFHLARHGSFSAKTLLLDYLYHDDARAVTARKIVEARKNIKIRYVADLEKVVGASLARRVNQYVDLKDKKLTDFSKSK